MAFTLRWLATGSAADFAQPVGSLLPRAAVSFFGGDARLLFYRGTCHVLKILRRFCTLCRWLKNVGYTMYQKLRTAACFLFNLLSVRKA